jgi:hypothetical protein
VLIGETIDVAIGVKPNNRSNRPEESKKANYLKFINPYKNHPMKKFLLSLAAVIGLGSLANATETTFDLTDPTLYGYTAPAAGKATNVTTLTYGNITITASYDGVQTGQEIRFYNSNGDITFRNSKNGDGRSLNFASTDGSYITSIVITASSYGSSNTWSVGTFDSSSKTWTGSAASVTMSISGANTFSKIVVTTVEATADYVAVPTFSVKEGTYYDAQSVELTQADADAIYYTLDGTEPTTASTKYEGAIEVAETTTIKAIAVKGENTSEVAEATYTIEKRAEAKSINDIFANNAGVELTVNCPLTVAFINGGNIFVTDGTDFIQIYKVDSGLSVNDVIPAGWVATYTIYNTYTPELVPTGDLPAATETDDFTPAAVDASEISIAYVNCVIMVENVTFDEATPSTKTNFTGKVGETELTFRNNYTLDSVVAGTYNVEALVNVYNGAAQLYVIAYTATGTDGIANVAADNNAAAEYFNLQGVRVANPTNGLFIRRQGNNVQKVLVK